MSAASGAVLAVQRVVANAHRAATVARWGEGGLLFAAGVALVLAAAVASGGELAVLDTWLVAAAAGGCTAGSWLVATRRDLHGTARHLDRELSLDGALVTAFEAGTRNPEEDLVRLLAVRVRERLVPREALRRALPHSAFPIAAPFLAAALLALALEGVAEPPPSGASLEELGERVQVELSNARSLSLDELDRGTAGSRTDETLEQPRELGAFLERFEELQRGWVEDGPEERLERLDRLRADWSEWLRAVPPSAPVAERARRIAGLLDAARLRLADERTLGDRASGAGPGEGGLASAAGDATMSAPSGPDSEVRASAFEAEERGAAIPTRAWAPEYREIVARWAELERGATEQ